MSNYTIDRITNEFHKACASQKVLCDTPIKLNGRLSTTLGQVKWHNNGKGGGTPTAVEFSKKFVETSTDEDVRQVILHEASHYIVMKERPCEDHGHDEVFRATCARIGCRKDRSTSSVEMTNKYNLYCACCGKKVFGSDRMCKRIREPWNYQSRCCHANLVDRPLD